MKYIIVKDRDDEEHAIVFPDKIIHKDVARIHRATDVRVVSAGFCCLTDLIVWSKSESIGKEHRDADAAILRKDFG